MSEEKIADIRDYNLETGARRIGVSYPTMLELVRRDDFPAFRIGRRWVIPRNALVRWLDEQAAKRAQL